MNFNAEKDALYSIKVLWECIERIVGDGVRGKG